MSFTSHNRDVNSAKDGGVKSAVATVKYVRQLGCILQDAAPPESLPILRKGPSFGTNSTSTIHKSCAAASKHPGKTKVHRRMKYNFKLHHQRSPDAVKIEERSQEETERQERCAEMRGDW